MHPSLRLLLLLGAATCSGCASLTPGGPPIPSDNTARGGAPTVTQENAATAAPAAATIGGVGSVPSAH